jgi:hypothetical protein
VRESVSNYLSQTVYFKLLFLRLEQNPERRAAITFVCYAHRLQVGSVFLENSPCNSDYFPFRRVLFAEILRSEDMIRAGTTILRADFSADFSLVTRGIRERINA